MAEITAQVAQQVARLSERVAELVQDVQAVSTKQAALAGLPHSYAWLESAVQTLLTWRTQTQAREAAAPVPATQCDLERIAAQAKDAQDQLTAVVAGQIAAKLEDLQTWLDRAQRPSSIAIRAVEVRPVFRNSAGPSGAAQGGQFAAEESVPVFKRRSNTAAALDSDYATALSRAGASVVGGNDVARMVMG